MAVTDALSVAFKAVGIAADIYMGNYDDSKYQYKADISQAFSELQQLPVAQAATNQGANSPPHRRLRKIRFAMFAQCRYSPPHRRLRNLFAKRMALTVYSPPHRRLRKNGFNFKSTAYYSPPHRRLRNE